MLNLTMAQDTHHTHTIETVMGLDFGIAKMGIALGNTLTQTASPLMQFKMDNGKPNWDELLKIIESWQVSTIIIGLPLNMDGTASELGNRAKKFARRLKHQLEEAHRPRPIILADERYYHDSIKRVCYATDQRLFCPCSWFD